MKSIVNVALSLCLFGALFVDSAFAARTQRKSRSLATTCSKIESLPSGSYIYKNSAPVRSSAPGAPIVGYRSEPTLIFNKRNFSGGTQTIYDGSGNSIGRCPITSAHGHAGRARCTMQTGSLRRTAVKNTRSPSVYFKINSKTCVKVPDAGRCYGSVKGLCNRTIT